MGPRCRSLRTLIAGGLRAAGVGLFIVVLGPASIAQDRPPEPRVHIDLGGTVPDGGSIRRFVRASLPWPPGRRDRSDLLVGTLGPGEAPSLDPALPSTPPQRGPFLVESVPILFWPDGSVRVEQLHLDLELVPGRSTVRLETVGPGSDRLERLGERPDSSSWPFSSGVLSALRFELIDPWDRRFDASFTETDWQVDPALSSDRLRVRRARVLCRRTTTERPDEAPDEVLLAVEASLVEALDWPWAELTVALVNDPRDDEPIHGPTRFRRFSFVCDDLRVRALPRAPAALKLDYPTITSTGFRQDLLGDNAFLYLGDRTRIAFRLDLVLASKAGGEASARIAPPSDGWEDAVARARDLVERRALGLPDLEWVRFTGAYGPLGGPAPVEDRLLAREAAADAISDRRHGLDTGPFGAFAEPRDGLRFGRSRCGPTVLHQVLRSGLPDLLALAELAVLHHGLRPPPAEVRLPEAQARFRQGIPPFALEQPHGYAPLDYEHLTAALCFDAFWLTGDAFARDECRRIASVVDDFSRSVAMRTSRGEGRLLQTAAILSALEPGRRLLQRVTERFLERFGSSASPLRAVFLPQPALDRALGPEHPFDATWQVAEVVRGLAAAGRLVDPPLQTRLSELQLDLTRGLAREAFVERGPAKSLVSATDPDVYSTLPGDGPDAWTRAMLVDAFVLSEPVADEPSEVERFRRLADQLVDRLSVTPESRLAADRWLQVWFDRRAAGPR